MKSVLGSYLTGVGLPIEPCRVYWGSHGCHLPRGHHRLTPEFERYCRCECADDEEDGNVGGFPYYGNGTSFYGEDAIEVWGASILVIGSAEVEPPPGTTGTDGLGRVWSRDVDGVTHPDGFANWTRDYVKADPESWIKVAGNYGPFRITGKW